MTTSKLYYEAHVTIDPVFDERREHASAIAMTYGFRLAKLIMRKQEATAEQPAKDDTFMTGHGVELSMITRRLVKLVEHLKERGFVVRRYKIEDTIMDSRQADELGLLGNPS